MTTPDYQKHNFVDGPAGGTPITAAILNDDEAAIVAMHAQMDLTPTQVKAGNYTASPGDFVPADIASSSWTLILPTAPADKTKIQVKVVGYTSGNTLTVAAGGSDVFNKVGAGTTFTFSVQFSGALFKYDASKSVWYVQNDLPLAQLDSRYAAAVNAVLAGRTYRKGDKPATPSSGVYFGSYSSIAAVGSETASLASRAGQIGRPFDIGHHYYTFTDTSFPGSQENVEIAANRLPLISWQLTSLNSINSGSQDTVITAAANRVASFGWPVFLRPGWEMNGNWYTWSGPQNASDPSLYVRAWQRIWRLFRAAGVTNAAFVWSPNSFSSPGGTTLTDANNWRFYYPGDAYVDWVSADAYNWGDSGQGASWTNLRNVLDPIVADWKTNFGGYGGASKPFMLAEFNTYPTPGNKAHWYTDAFAYVRTSGINAAVIFDADNSPIQGSSSINWAIDSTAQALTAYKEAAADPMFNGYGIGGGGYRARVLLDTPFAYWKLDTVSGTYPDYGSGGNVGTPTTLANRGAPAISPALGEGASFNGSSRIDFGTCGTLGSSLSAGFTIEFLVKVGATSATRSAAAVLGTLNTGTTTAVAVLTDTNRSLAATTGSTAFWYRNEAGTDRALDITTNIYDGLWHHVIWVCDPSVATDTVYVDGAAITPNSSSNAANTGASANFGFPLWIGARNNRGTADNQLVGAVDEVSIYLSKLTSTKAAAHYAAVTA